MDLAISVLQEHYRAGTLKPSEVLNHVLGRLKDEDQDNVWISTVDEKKARERAYYLDSQLEQMESLPLYGLPFSVKDNIDVQDEPTTAACPTYSYQAENSATVVQSAIDAGAMYIGKTNLDQFATGLVGVRSPYGIPRNPFNKDYIPGGSSAGAGVSVSTGLVSFAFGTDTGGSGRVPASYNGIAGLKPAPGQLSRRGLVFACRSIDTPTVFAKTAADTLQVFSCVSGDDKLDPYYASMSGESDRASEITLTRFAVPGRHQLKFFGNAQIASLFDRAVVHLSDLVSAPVPVDFDLLTAINDLMFFGPLLAERDVSVGAFVDAQPDSCDPIVQQLIQGSRQYTAADAYSSLYRIADARVKMQSIWDEVEVLMVPTVGNVYTLAEIANDPLQPNFNNGFYTNFANPLGLSAIATPFAMTSEGVPWGVTFLFKPGIESQVASLADAFSSHWKLEVVSPNP